MTAVATLAQTAPRGTACACSAKADDWLAVASVASSMSSGRGKRFLGTTDLSQCYALTDPRTGQLRIRRVDPRQLRQQLARAILDASAS